MKITDGTQCPSYPVPLDVELKHSIINIVGSNLKWFKAPRKWQKLNIVISITKCTIFWCSYDEVKFKWTYNDFCKRPQRLDIK